jgi:hypothetical protein
LLVLEKDDPARWDLATVTRERWTKLLRGFACQTDIDVRDDLLNTTHLCKFKLAMFASTRLLCFVARESLLTLTARSPTLATESATNTLSCRLTCDQSLSSPLILIKNSARIEKFLEF